MILLEDIANKIRNLEDNYILKVKNNQKDLKDDIKTYFDLGLKRDDVYIAIGKTNWKKNHGRLEKKYYLSYDINCINNIIKWKSVKAIDKIDVTREENGVSTTTKH